MLDIPQEGPYDRSIRQAIRQLIQGRNNANGTVTLTANTTTTTVTQSTINKDAGVFLFPTTANAAAAIATTYANVAATGGAFTLTPANNAQTDRTFYYVVLGG